MASQPHRSRAARCGCNRVRGGEKENEGGAGRRDRASASEISKEERTSEGTRTVGGGGDGERRERGLVLLLGSPPPHDLPPRRQSVVSQRWTAARSISRSTNDGSHSLHLLFVSCRFLSFPSISWSFYLSPLLLSPFSLSLSFSTSISLSLSIFPSAITRFVYLYLFSFACFVVIYVVISFYVFLSLFFIQDLLIFTYVREASCACRELYVVIARRFIIGIRRAILWDSFWRDPDSGRALRIGVNDRESDESETNDYLQGKVVNQELVHDTDGLYRWFRCRSVQYHRDRKLPIRIQYNNTDKEGM